MDGKITGLAVLGASFLLRADTVAQARPPTNKLNHR